MAQDDRKIRAGRLVNRREIASAITGSRRDIDRDGRRLPKSRREIVGVTD